MPANTSLTFGADASGTNYILQEAIGGYSDEAYTAARKLSSTGIVGNNPNIDVNTETYVGQMRWRTNVNETINVASLSDAGEGALSDYGTAMLKYIKSVRNYGAKKINMKQVVTQEDGLAKIGRDFGEIRAQDEHDYILAALKAVATSEVLNGCAEGSGATGNGGQTWDNDPTDKSYGFYVDMTTTLLNKVGYESNGSTGNAAYVGAQRAEGFLEAFGKAYKDYEPDWAYLIVSPKTLASLRSANLVDQTTITDGNLDFQTIFNGKFRLIQTRANQSLAASDITLFNGAAGGNITAAALTSYIVLPGALSFTNIPVPDQVEIDRDASIYKGGGVTEIWYRWGYILHPAGYSWAGAEDDFVSNGDFNMLNQAGTMKTIAAATTADATLANTTAVFDRKAGSALGLGILPIFHL